MKFDFDDINLVPRKGIVGSRSECDTSVSLGKFKFKSPIIPANMECVLNEELAIKLASNNYFYIMHRFDINIIDFIKKMNELDLISSISIGVNDDSYELIDVISDNNYKLDYITIDIAHGHSIKMENIIKVIKQKLPNTFIIAGNVSTTDGVNDLEYWGADAIKVGIGPGSACFIDGTLVKTISGYKPIEDVLVGDKVLTHKKTYEEVINTITYNSSEKLLKINGEICTENHEFLIIKKEDINNITDENYMDYASFEQAKNIDEDIHMILCITE